MTNPDHLSPRDLERLSAYLDGEIPKKEAENLEARLRTETDLRRALEGLRATAALLRALPEVSPPRDFALTPEMVGIERRRPYPVLRLATVLASMAFVALVGLDAITTALPLAGSMAPEAALRDTAPQEGMVAEAPLMAPEPGALPAEEIATGETQEGFFGAEQDETEMLRMTEEAVEPIDGIPDESGVPPESPLKCCGKAIMPIPVGTSIGGPVPTEDVTQVEIEPLPDEPGRASEIPAWPVWRIGLRIGEFLFGMAALVLTSFMIWARRK